ncbi:hypothetical protein SCLCIDRAFT_161646 [Scleroderma citrinum Foug A]|uniref:Uncharacterized protein n=1 Tax=Scleroderma citrinum Foug A TaxID=1036808 RepID=A0A0C3ERC0_9AGAM|nr:hypothetical protein SCLCIDRAFT_161646 [Scleroderma citrinum Foug A]
MSPVLSLWFIYRTFVTLRYPSSSLNIFLHTSHSSVIPTFTCSVNAVFISMHCSDREYTKSALRRDGASLKPYRGTSNMRFL